MRNWRGNPGFVASIRASASPSAATVVMVAVIPANPEPSRAHLRRRRVPLYLLTVEFKPGWLGIDRIILDLPASAAHSPAQFRRRGHPPPSPATATCSG